MSTGRILIVDDEPNIGHSLRLILEREGYRVTVCESVAQFRERPAAEPADLYVLDVRLPDGNGIDLLRELREGDDQTPVVMVSGHGTIRDAVDATRMGAFDFLEKPLARDRVLLVLRHALEQSRLQRENQRFRELVGETPTLLGQSDALQRVIGEASRAATSDVSVLLTGESGTGKELLAHHIHRVSPVAAGPFVKVNCAAIPSELLESELFGHERGAFTGAAKARRGKFELAHGGSLFLDEVGDLQEASQAKLLRALQDGEVQRLGGERATRVSVRIISATNRPLDRLKGEGKFREDLYYRLCVVPIRVPALRERAEDIGLLAGHFLTEFCARNNLRPKALDPAIVPLLERYPWPGNVRELRNIVERMAILTSEPHITVEAVPPELRESPAARGHGLSDARDTAERDRILQALEATGWNVSAAARSLGVERTTLHKRMRTLGVSRER